MAGTAAGGIPTVVFCDFDGTITRRDVWDTIMERFDERDWRAHAREYAAGRLGSRELYTIQMEGWTLPEDEARAHIRAETHIDAEFPHFVALLREHGVPLHVVSDGFTFYIREVLAQHGLDDLPIVASELHFEPGGTLRLELPYARPECRWAMANCKCTHLLAHRGHGERIVYLGDSTSDACAAGQADLVFAKRSLVGYCAERGVACIPFESFADVLAAPEFAALLALAAPQEREA